MPSNRPLRVASSGAPAEPNDSLPNSLLEFPFPSVISNPHHDVPAQLTRPTREFLSFASPRCDRAEKFIELLVQRRAVREPLPAAPRAVELTAAIDCPDLYLIALRTNSTTREDLANKFVQLAAERNLRVLFLTDSSVSANNLVEALQNQSSQPIGRALAPDEELGKLSPQVAQTTASSIAEQEYLEYLKQLDAQIEAIEKSEALRNESQETERERDIVRKEIEIFISYRIEHTSFQAELTRALQQKLAAAQKLEELRQQSPTPVGFFKKLFGGKAEPDAQQVQIITEAESQLCATEQCHAELAAREQCLIERQQLLEQNGGLARLEERQETLSRRHAELEEQLRQLPTEANCECCTTELSLRKAKKQELLNHPPHASREKLDAVRVVVGVLDAIGHDPFLIASHPEAEPIFDKLIYLNGESVSEVDFLDTARMAHSWVVVAGEESLQTLKPYRNGKPLPQGTFFEWTWAALDTRPFIRLNEKWIARLQPIPVEFAATETSEPLSDRPEIELHFYENDQLELAEIHFPGTMSLPEVKAFLAHELGEARFAVSGEAEWQSSEHEIVCHWPAIEATTETRLEVALIDGICEWLSGAEPHAKTARVTFSCSEGWTLESAQAWLASRIHPSIRNAIY